MIKFGSIFSIFTGYQRGKSCQRNDQVNRVYKALEMAYIMMNVESATPVGTPDSLLDQLIESQSFKANPVRWGLFYGSAAATLLMFIILCSLASWSISVGAEISVLMKQASDILKDVEEMLPMLQTICKHENFTRSYGNVCQQLR